MTIPIWILYAVIVFAIVLIGLAWILLVTAAWREREAHLWAESVKGHRHKWHLYQRTTSEGRSSTDYRCICGAAMTDRGQQKTDIR